MTKTGFPSSVPALIFALALPVLCMSADGQQVTPADQKLHLRAALVLDRDFCATKIKKNHETFEVGKAACAEFVSVLQQGYSGVTSGSSTADTGEAQVVLIPRFIDLSATKTMGAFSTRELTVFLAWTVKDKSGRTVWIETVQGSGKNHMGNGFTYRTDLKEIIHYAIDDLARKSIAEMDASPELRKLEQKAASTP